MRSEQEAYDIVQEVFLKRIKHTGKFQCEEHEKAWLLRVAINCCKDKLKSHWWKKQVSWDEYEGRMAFGNREGEDSVDTQEERQMVLSAIRSLPPIYKEVVILYYYGGYRTEEIAGLIHKSASTVRSRLQKARELLKRFLR